MAGWQIVGSAQAMRTRRSRRPAAIGAGAAQPSTRPSQSRHAGCTVAGLPGPGQPAPGQAGPLPSGQLPGTRLCSLRQRPGHIWTLCRSGL